VNFSQAFKTFHATKISEPDLKNFFVLTDSIRQIKENKDVCIISGLKGIGKTATFRELSEFDTTQDIIVEIYSDKYTLALQNSNLRAINYSHEFEYEIAIELLQKVVESKDLHPKVPQKLLREAKSHIDAFIGELVKLGGRVTGISVLGCGFNLSDPEKKVLTGLRGRENEIKALETLQSICDAGIKARLVIDDPEEVFFTERTLNVNILGGLCLAATRLNALSSNLRAFILMKTHIYDYVYTNTPDLDKYPNSHVSICWDEVSLKQLIEKRIRYFLKTEDNWENLLFGDIPTNSRDKIYEYIFKNIRNGPRELVSWLSFAFEYAKSNGINGLSLDALKRTYSKLSRDSFIHFNSSNSEEFQNIGTFVKLLFEGKEDTVFSKRQLTDRIRELQANNEDFQNLQRQFGWVQKTISNEFSDLLFRVGAINLMGKKEIYPYTCSYTSSSFDMTDKFRLTHIFSNYLKGMEHE
jgi:hypothetical protein